VRARIAVLACLLVLAGCAGDARTADPAPTPAPTDMQPTATESPSEGPLRFLAIGDFGDGSAEQYAIANRMCLVHQRRPFNLVVTVGDNVYDEGDPARFDEVFFRPYACLLERGVQFRATLGNHDIGTENGRPQLREPAFGFRGRNYVFREDGVRFVMADSNALDRDWLRAALRPEQGDDWTIVVFHHPVFSSGEYGPTPGFRPELPRMFQRFGVDLVLNGHEHHYEVTNELRGIRYVITGGGGASIRECGGIRPFSNVCIERFHFLEVLVGQEQIEVRALPASGRSFHRFTTDGRD
jgi:hypothetical protein